MEMIECLVLTYLANVVWMTCLIAVVTIVLAKVIRHGPPAHRHALWVLALIFASLLPLTTLRNALNADGSFLTLSFHDTNTQLLRTGVVTSSADTLSHWNGARHRAVAFAPLLTHLLTALYVLFVIYRGFSLGWALHRTQRVAKGARCRSLSSQQAAALAHCCSALQLGGVSIASSDDFHGPVVVGVWHPRLILPEWLFSHASEQELLSAICHELAHIRRYDFLANLVHELILLPISFHPAARVIKSEIERSRELACDEIAAGNLPTRTAYARSLVSIAQTIAATSSSVPARYALELLSPNTLEERVMNLFKKRNHSHKTWGLVQTAVASCLLAAACLGASAFSVQVARSYGTPAELQRFVGIWGGKFKGKTFVTLILTAKDGKIVGSVSRVNIQMSANGILTDASPLAGEDAISEATPEGKVLHLSTKAKGQISTIAGNFEESIQYDMRLGGADQTDLQIALVRTGMPVPAAWKLERTSTAP